MSSFPPDDTSQAHPLPNRVVAAAVNFSLKPSKDPKAPSMADAVYRPGDVDRTCRLVGRRRKRRLGGSADRVVAQTEGAAARGEEDRLDLDLLRCPILDGARPAHVHGDAAGVARRDALVVGHVRGDGEAGRTDDHRLLVGDERIDSGIVAVGDGLAAEAIRGATCRDVGIVVGGEIGVSEACFHRVEGEPADLLERLVRELVGRLALARVGGRRETRGQHAGQHHHRRGHDAARDHELDHGEAVLAAQ